MKKFISRLLQIFSLSLIPFANANEEALVPLFKFAAIADIQYADKDPSSGRRYREGIEKLSKIIGQLNQEKLAFVIDMGDLSDGIKKDDTGKVLDAYSMLNHKLYHVVGNHDMVLNRENELKNLFNFDNLNYEFSEKGFRFLVINSLDVSNYSNDPEKRKEAKNMLAENKQLRPYDGKLSKDLLSWMEAQFQEASKKSEKVIICSHVPASGKASSADPKACLWNSDELLGLLKKYNDTVVLWISGHHHQGGYAEIDGIHHLTLNALCNAPENGTSYAEFSVFSDRIIVKGYGTTPSRTLLFNGGTTKRAAGGFIKGNISTKDGSPVKGAWISTNTGKITKSDEAGKFIIEELSDAKYALKIISSGNEDSIIPEIAVESGASQEQKISTEKSVSLKKIIAGSIIDDKSLKIIPAYMEIKDGDKKLNYFDIGGLSYGARNDVPKDVWHQKNSRFWTNGNFVFSASSDNVTLTVVADGYESIRKEIKANGKTEIPLEIRMRKLYSLNSEGWYKGDFHAHGVHGEKLYKVNIPFMAFILRAEHYDWFYISSDFTNDGLKTDPYSIAAQEAGADLFLGLNSEYPKTKGGHVGNVGINAPEKPKSFSSYSNIETIKLDIAEKGGAAVPVHPLEGHMCYRELPFILLGAPELMNAFDFYTGSKISEAQKLYFMFLDKGYKFGLTATSDSAFDLGRTPGTMGATYIYTGSLRPDRNRITEAIKNGNTVVAWNNSFMNFTISGKVCGECFPADNSEKAAEITAYKQPNEKIILTVFRNGKEFKSFSGSVPESGKLSFNFTIRESEKAYYNAFLYREDGKNRPIAVSSPFYFGDWTSPPAVKASIKLELIDAVAKTPVKAEIELSEGGTVQQKISCDGVLKFEAGIAQRIKISAQGYHPVEKSIMKLPAIDEFVNNTSDKELQDWTHYEKAKQLLNNLEWNVQMKRK